MTVHKCNHCGFVLSVHFLALEALCGFVNQFAVCCAQTGRNSNVDWSVVFFLRYLSILKHMRAILNSFCKNTGLVCRQSILGHRIYIVSATQR